MNPVLEKKYHSSNLVPDAVPIIYQFHEEHYAQTYNHDGLNLLYKDEKGKDEKGPSLSIKYAWKILYILC